MVLAAGGGRSGGAARPRLPAAAHSLHPSLPPTHRTPRRRPRRPKRPRPLSAWPPPRRPRLRPRQAVGPRPKRRRPRPRRRPPGRVRSCWGGWVKRARGGRGEGVRRQPPTRTCPRPPPAGHPPTPSTTTHSTPFQAKEAEEMQGFIDAARATPAGAKKDYTGELPKARTRQRGLGEGGAGRPWAPATDARSDPSRPIPDAPETHPALPCRCTTRSWWRPRHTRGGRRPACLSPRPVSATPSRPLSSLSPRPMSRGHCTWGTP